MHVDTPIFRKWLAAAKAAEAAERELHVAALRYAGREGLAPEPELVARATALRDAAHALFPLAMQELKEAADLLRQPAVPGPDRASSSHA